MKMYSKADLISFANYVNGELVSDAQFSNWEEDTKVRLERIVQMMRENNISTNQLIIHLGGKPI